MRGLCCPGYGHTLSLATCWYPYSLLPSSAPLFVICLHRLPPSPLSAFVVSPFISVISPLSSPLVIVVSPCHSPPLSLSIPVGGDVAVSTRSALQANARSGGGRVLGHHHRSLPPLRCLSPPVHPASWGSQRWWCRPVPLGCRHSTHYPPHEQLLVRLEAGGVLSVIVVGPWSWWS